MIIKINGLPWDEVKTPDPQIDLPGVGSSYLKTLYAIKSITDHAYKASCWTVDKILTALGGG